MNPEDVVEKVIKGVVNITVEKTVIDRYMNMEELKGSGSGFVICEDTIVTNYHVVQDSQVVFITTTDGRNLEGKILDTDRTLDIAFVSVKDLQLSPLKLGDSEKIRVGEMVLAIGNPLGVFGSPTVTLGIVSAKNRSVRTDELIYENLIQTDAAINPGNSGGPLVNMNGEIIGLTSAMITQAQGIGFAIPVNNIKILLSSIQKFGKIVKPSIGINGVSINSRIADYYNLPMDHGIWVTGVLKNSPAEKAGIIKNDIILKFNGKELSGIEELKYLLATLEVGNEIKLGVLRKGKEMEKLVVLG